MADQKLLLYTITDSHNSYFTKSCYLVAAGPDVAVNLILGLPFIKATGMIGDFVDNVCQAKHLLCEPFPIDFKRASKSTPVFSAAHAPCNVGDTQGATHVFAALRNLFPRPNDTSSAGLLVKSQKTRFALTDRWIPPMSSDSSASTDANDYHHQVLRDLGYL